MYDQKTSIIIIFFVISSALSVLHLLKSACKVVSEKNKEFSLAYAQKIETDRKEFAFLICSLNKQQKTLLERVEKLETQRDVLEKENEECFLEVRALKKQLDKLKGK